jgi:hypothetical protein
MTRKEFERLIATFRASKFLTPLETKNLINHLDQLTRNPLVAVPVREVIVAEECGFRHSGKRRGPDAFTYDGEPVEIKTESTSRRKHGFKKLGGDGTFGAVSLTNIDNQTDRHLVAGFHDEKLVYIIQFRFYPEFSRLMAEKLNTNGKKTILKFNNVHLRDLQNLELSYYSDDCKLLGINDISEIITSDLLSLITTLQYTDK